MSYDFNTLYQDWVNYVRSQSPNVSDDTLTVEDFVSNIQVEIEDMINEGDEIPESHLFVVENYNPQG